MNTLEVMKQALEALERYQVKRQDFDRFAEEITALRSALEATENIEPVGWWNDEQCYIQWKPGYDPDTGDKYYLSPAPAVSKEVEPVACVSENGRLLAISIKKEHIGAMLYTHPAPAVEKVEPVAWMYEYDGMVHDKFHPPVFSTERKKAAEPWSETPLYTHPAPAVSKDAEPVADDVRYLRQWLNEELTAPIDRKALARVLASITHPAPAIPPGYQLVPKEPTEEMLDAPDVSVSAPCFGCGDTSVGWRACKDIYKAMLSAAPEVMK